MVNVSLAEAEFMNTNSLPNEFFIHWPSLGLSYGGQSTFLQLQMLQELSQKAEEMNISRSAAFFIEFCE